MPDAAQDPEMHESSGTPGSSQAPPAPPAPPSTPKPPRMSPALAQRAAAGGRCLTCDYDLTGLPDDGSCPECGLEVIRSRDRSKWLRGADVRWLGNIRRGLGDLELSMRLLFAGLVAIMLLLLMHFFLINFAGIRAPRYVDTIVDSAALLLMLAAALIHLRGTFLVSMAANGDYGLPVWMRTVLRFSGILLPLSLAGVIVFRRELTLYPSPNFLAIRTAIEINALAFFWTLAAALEHYERRTVAWSVDRRIRHARVRINLGLLLVVLVINGWFFQIPILGSTFAGVPMLLIGLAYLAFGSAVSRVRQEVQMEHLIAREAGGWKDKPTPA